MQNPFHQRPIIFRSSSFIAWVSFTHSNVNSTIHWDDAEKCQHNQSDGPINLQTHIRRQPYPMLKMLWSATAVSMHQLVLKLQFSWILPFLLRLPELLGVLKDLAEMCFALCLKWWWGSSLFGNYSLNSFSSSFSLSWSSQGLFSKYPLTPRGRALWTLCPIHSLTHVSLCWSSPAFNELQLN